MGAKKYSMVPPWMLRTADRQCQPRKAGRDDLGGDATTLSLLRVGRSRDKRIGDGRVSRRGAFSGAITLSLDVGQRHGLEIV
jgi:hypothetical protein